MNILGNRKIYAFIVIIVTIISIAVFSIYLQQNTIIMFLGIILAIVIFPFIYKSDETLLFCTIFGSIFSNFLDQYISIFAYLPQLFLIVMLIKILDNILIKKKAFRINNVILIVFVLMVLVDMISICFSQFNINIVLFLYTLLRRYAFFITLTFIFNSNINIKTLYKFSNVLTVFLIINMIFIIIQFLHGIRDDYLNGFFGYKANGLVLQSFSVILVLNITNYRSEIAKKVKIINIVGLICLYIFYCTIAEVKFGFIILPIIFILNLMDTERKLYNSVLIGIVIVVLNIGYGYLINIYPNMKFADTKFLKVYLTGSYNETNTINRFGYMEALKSTVLTDDTKLLLGNGVGSANESNNKDILNGPINKKFGFMQINWFSIPYTIVENGIVGLMLFLSIYIYIVFKSTKDWIVKKDKFYITINIITFIAIIFLFYNNQMTNIYSMIFLVWFYIGVYLKENISE